MHSNNIGYKRFGSISRRAQRNPSSRRPTMLLVPENESGVIAEIESVIQKWGVDANRNETHQLFASSVKKAAVDCFNCDVGIGHWESIDTSVRVPTDINEALYLLLEHNLKQVTKN